MREHRWAWAHQTGRHQGIRWWRRVRIHVHCGMIVSMETVSPKGAWTARDYADLPSVSGLRVGDAAPTEVRQKARRWEHWKRPRRRN